MDPVTYSSGDPIMPGVVTDANGVFVFENISPGTYSLYSMTWKTDWYDTSTRMPKVFRLEPGATLDLGEVWFTV